MKRSMDDGDDDDDNDDYVNSIQKRRMVPSPNDFSGQAPMIAGSGKLSSFISEYYLSIVRDEFQDEGKYDSFQNVFKEFNAGRIDITAFEAQIKKILREDTFLIQSLNIFLPEDSVITLDNEDETTFPMRTPAKCEEVINFVNKIKRRFQGDDHVYKSFLRIFCEYGREVISIKDVNQEVINLFGDHIDLIEEFGHFLPRPTRKASNNYRQSGSTHDSHSNHLNYVSRSRHLDKHFLLRPKSAALHANRDFSIDQSDQDHDKFRMGSDNELQRNGDREKDRRDYNECRKRKLDNKDYYHDSAQNVSLNCKPAHEVGESDRFQKGAKWSSERIPLSIKVKNRDGDQIREKHYIHRDPENREKENLHKATLGGKDGSESQICLLPYKDKFLIKPIQELDLADCERCTPSYRHWPKKYPILSASSRTDIDASILNDHWVSVATGSEDYSFKHMCKTPYEEILFRCEENRYELDMFLECLKATTKRVQELVDKISDNTVKTSSISIDDHFTASNKRCIERVYGDHGLELMDLLLKYPLLSLEVILYRLKQKQEECTILLSDCGKIWTRIYAKNYHKSLDYRSFNFSQQESASLSTEALLAEIRELSDNQCKDDDILLSIAAGNRRPILPNLVFELPDSDIHVYLCQLIRTSCQYMCTPEQLGNVMKVCTTLLESVFGVSSNLQHAEDTKNIVKADLVAYSVDPCTEESDDSHVGVPAINNSSQSKPYRKEDEHTLSVHSGSSAWLVSKDKGVNKDDEQDPDHSTPNNDYMCENSQLGKLQVNVTQMDETSTIRKIEHPQNSSVSAAAGVENSYENMENAPGLYATMKFGKDVASDQLFENLPSSVEGGDCIEAASGARTESTNGQRCNEECARQFQTEREEGELSPNGDYEGHTFPTYGEANHKPSNGATYRIRHGVKVCCEDGVESDDDYRGNISDDSENTSENHDALRSEPTGDCSRKGHEVDCKEYDLKAESEDEIEREIVNSHDVDENAMLLPLPKHFLKSARPLAIHMPALLHDKKKEKSFEIFYGNDSFYVLFRLYQTLYDRITCVKAAAEHRWMVSNDTTPAELCDRFMNVFYKLLDGSSDTAEYEDHCKTLMGAESYIMFTLDKLVRKLVKQLKKVATDELDIKLLQLYAYEKSRTGCSFPDIIYHNNACALLQDESIYRIECSSQPLVMSIQLMNYHSLWKPEVDTTSMRQDVLSYVENSLVQVTEEKQESGVVLKRNKRKIGCSDAEVSEAMEGLQNFNGLVKRIKISSKCKVGYTVDTEDFFCRPKKRRTLHRNGSSQDQAKLLDVSSAKGNQGRHAVRWTRLAGSHTFLNHLIVIVSWLSPQH